jgi:hypothetical protein
MPPNKARSEPLEDRQGQTARSLHDLKGFSTPAQPPLSPTGTM